LPHPLSCPGEGSPRPALEVADIFRTHGEVYRASRVLTPEQGRAMSAIGACRTAALGAHEEDVCDCCGFTRPAYNSCRNRHCPKCQAGAQAAWVQKHVARILPTHYFHGVFTLPAELRGLVHRNRRLLFGLLFETASETLLDLGQDRLGATLGITAVLHTWTRDMSFHPHVHCVVTGGGLATDDASWVATEKGYLFPYLVVSRLFRGKFLSGLARLYGQGALDLGGECETLAEPEVFRLFKDRLYRKEWVVYQKPPFAGPEDVYRYLGRYTHRIAISNHRLLGFDEKGVRFKTKHGKSVTLKPEEFIRRFLLHVLPKGFVRIRHYGLLAPCHTKAKLETAHRLLATGAAASLSAPDAGDESRPSCDKDESGLTATAPDSALCPRCGQGVLRRRPLPERRRPPPGFPS
jgi:hypothetical protein